MQGLILQSFDLFSMEIGAETHGLLISLLSLFKQEDKETNISKNKNNILDFISRSP
jgi:hypothetical protein